MVDRYTLTMKTERKLYVIEMGMKILICVRKYGKERAGNRHHSVICHEKLKVGATVASAGGYLTEWEAVRQTNYR